MPYRQDKDITREIPGFRRMLNFLTPDRDAASVFFKQTLDLTETLPWLEAQSEALGRKVTLLHLFIACAGRMLHEQPRINRYVAGWRFYQRSDVTISVSAKKALRDGAKVVLLKVPIEPDDGVEQIVERFAALLGEGRSQEIRQEKEVGLFLHLPGFILAPVVKLVLWLQNRHLLPGPMFVDPDPMFTSLVAANLGSVGLDAAYHHLYEYGNCPFFAVIGKIREEPVAIDGEVQIRTLVDIKYTFDERVEDGLACAIALSGFKEMMESPDRLQTGYTDLDGRPPERT